MKKKRKLIILISSILIGLLLPISLVSATTNETYNYNSDKSKLTRVVVISSNEKYIPEEILSTYFDNEKITREYKLTDTKKDELKTKYTQKRENMTYTKRMEEIKQKEVEHEKVEDQQADNLLTQL